jgi:hypothetical protein
MKHWNLGNFLKVFFIENRWIEGFEFYFGPTMIDRVNMPLTKHLVS